MNPRAVAIVAAAWLALGSAGTWALAQNAAAVRYDDIKGLPLHEVPTKSPSPTTAAVFLSGDGGWAGMDRRVSEDLAAHGVSVVGLDSRAYLMKARTPDEAAADIARVIRHYTTQWAVQHVALVGYSRGADMAPFIVNRLPERPSLRVGAGRATRASRAGQLPVSLGGPADRNVEAVGSPRSSRSWSAFAGHAGAVRLREGREGIVMPPRRHERCPGRQARRAATISMVTTTRSRRRSFDSSHL